MNPQDLQTAQDIEDRRIFDPAGPGKLREANNPEARIQELPGGMIAGASNEVETQEAICRRPAIPAESGRSTNNARLKGDSTGPLSLVLW